MMDTRESAADTAEAGASHGEARSMIDVRAGGVTAGPRRRPRASIALEDVARGAAPEVLDQPAGELLAAVPWQGPAPDPEVLDAVTFLAWL